MALAVLAVFPIPMSSAASPPMIEIVDAKTGYEGDLLTFALYADEPDGDAVAWSASGLPAGATLTDFGHHSARFDWTPPLGAAGGYVVGFTAMDPDGDSDSISLSITVLTPPAAPYFTFMEDQPLAEGQITTSDVRARDAQGDPMTLTVSGLPAWGSFLDLGSGHGRFTWSTPLGILGFSTPVDVTASGTGSSTESFLVSVVGWVDLELHVPGDGFIYASPGDVLALPIEVHNHGNTGATVTFRNSLFYTWSNVAPPPVFVPAGGTVTVDATVVVPYYAHRNWVTVVAEAVGYFGQWDFVTWQVRVPLTIDVDVTQPGPIIPARGDVRLSYYNGDPAIGLPMTVTESWTLHPLGLLENTANLVSDSSGEATFGFALIGTSGVPLSHNLRIDVNRYGVHDILDTSYDVLLGDPW